MRYVFTLLGVMIVWRAFAWLRKDRRQKHRRLRQLPDAGTIGMLEVLRGGKHLRPGDVLPIPYEGTLGFLRSCDVVVPAEGVANCHLDFVFTNGKGLFVYPRRGCSCEVDGMALTSRGECRRCPLQHGSTLTIGDAILRLSVFAGLNVGQVEMPASMRELPELPDSPDAPLPPDQPLPPEQAPPMPAYPSQGVPYSMQGTPPIYPPQGIATGYPQGMPPGIVVPPRGDYPSAPYGYDPQHEEPREGIMTGYPPYGSNAPQGMLFLPQPIPPEGRPVRPARRDPDAP